MNDPQLRALWLAVSILTAVLIGAAAGAISWSSNRKTGPAVLAGGAGFCGTLLLIFAAFQFVLGGSA
ncbi:MULTISPECIES: hypothetical protein [Micromonospora]|uniref:Uncharacterized protein n=1 Tax=Micromonospora tulbaghiae TaxID=479978 RepID=A0AAW4JG57_9ACTN|nr:hypothetical protein [Micromonospora tulbaghiae]MBO4141261.1 hypothetical protein [Micromonospora tulbaghiae]